MFSSSYQKSAADFATFFGDAKRLQLLASLLPQIQALQEQKQEPLRILDVGAGTGMHAAHFSKMGYDVTAVDPIEEMLLEGKNRYASCHITWVVDSLPQLKKIQHKQFDVIYSVAAWQYLQPEDRQIAMERLIALLAPGGVFAIVWPIPMSREFQFPLSQDDIHNAIKVVNEKRDKEQIVTFTQGHPILDPDGRMGFVEKTEKVYFHATIGKIPDWRLCHDLFEPKQFLVKP